MVYGDNEKEYIIALIVVSPKLIPADLETEFVPTLKK